MDKLDYLISSKKSIVAIDEVGRGSIAGPVVVCLTLWVKSNIVNSWVSEIKDSKKLSPIKRNKIFNLIKSEFNYLNIELISNCAKIKINFEDILPPKIYNDFDNLCLKNNNTFKCIKCVIGSSFEKEIDKYNIWNAIQIAINRALHILNLNDILIVFDGNLPIKLLKKFSDIEQILVKKGDDRFYTIGTSSIIAKVLRDEFMLKLNNVYSNYMLSSNKGYGTKDHFRLIDKYGISNIHRLSFLKSRGYGNRIRE